MILGEDDMRRILFTALATVTVAAGLWLASDRPADAQTVDSQRSLDILGRYNEATQAAITCENRQFGIPGETRIAAMAASASGEQYLAGSMLKKVEDSRGWMRMTISSMTCKDPVVMDRLAFFHAQIEPGLR